MIKLYTDAAVNQRTCQAAIGILIIQNGHQIQLSQKIQPMNNHEAEFTAAIIGFQKLIDLKADPTGFVFYYTDSKIVIDSLNKAYAKHFENQTEQLLTLQQHFSTVINTWIPDSQNHGAHYLATQALHAK
ncbi:ribonuclease HI family protein [Lentilactobacillus farraginis]|uniref:RNase H n=1 Tax=Lentilactobacillus farraginis DSM 18382 = JCM 14108 TaxID=1423743 RepID=X0PGE5_9LACO|nr:ribonuclease HI family protein [Lentilactobacillus farraginis]KRM07474.1 ribonuclease HI cell wall enzyme EBSB [Lentilactobacillus farraginis DSM 18382 = JCM 14108]GAF35446.1 RNase H [Lentilactobacillus farraginis DSM 18382 = JCM 14108]